MGKDYPVYSRFYDKQQRLQMRREDIVPDCLTFYLMSIFTLPNYDLRSQFERDVYMAKIQWVVNKAIGLNYYQGKYIDMVSKYMKANLYIKYEDLLKDTDFSPFLSII